MSEKHKCQKNVYLHIFPKSVFLRSFVEFLDYYFDKSEHYFILLPECHSGTVPYPESFSDFFSIDVKKPILQMIFDPKIIKLAYRADKIICHSLSVSALLLLSTHPFLIRKSVWVVWGYDLYDFREKDVLYCSYTQKVFFATKKVVAKRIQHIIARYPDCKLLRLWYHSTGQCAPIEPLYGGEENLLPPKDVIHDHLNILVGNSATETNRHLDVLQLLSKFSHENLRIYLPLSYGDKEYAQKVRESAKNLFGEKAIILDTFVPREEYSRFLQTIDVAIFNNNRQQALGNIATSLSVGAKVYLNEDSPLWNIFSECQFIIHPISSLTSISYDDFKYCNPTESQKNYAQAHQIYSNEHGFHGWAEVFNSI